MHQLQMDTSGPQHMNSTNQAQQVVFVYTCGYIHKYLTIVNEQGSLSLEEEGTVEVRRMWGENNVNTILMGKILRKTKYM